MSMKKLILTIGIVYGPTICASPPPFPYHDQAPSNKPVHVNVEVDNHDETHIHLQFFDNISPWVDRVSGAMQDKSTVAARATQEFAMSSFYLLRMLWRKNNCKITLGAITALYSAVYYELLKLEHYIKSPDRWAHWKSEADTTTLLEYKQQELAKMLLLEIHHRYTESSNPTDFVRPLIDFMSGISKEIEQIKLYKDCMQFLKRWRVEKLFWLDRALPDKSIDLLQRVVHLKSAFLSWAADYKINHGRAMLKDLE